MRSGNENLRFRGFKRRPEDSRGSELEIEIFELKFYSKGCKLGV